jgi:hypothetical protein
LKLPPSPALTYSAPSWPKTSDPIEWLGNCWHQLLTSTVSLPVIWLPIAVSRESRPDATQPSAVAPGGLGHPSDVPPNEPHLGGVPPISVSAVYST